MSGDPRETWTRLQRNFQSAQRQGRANLGGNPRNLFGTAAAIAGVMGGGYALNKSLFNGDYHLGDLMMMAVRL